VQIHCLIPTGVAVDNTGNSSGWFRQLKLTPEQRAPARNSFPQHGKAKAEPNGASLRYGRQSLKHGMGCKGIKK
jgi:hypothetical protein